MRIVIDGTQEYLGLAMLGIFLKDRKILAAGLMLCDGNGDIEEIKRAFDEHRPRWDEESRPRVLGWLWWWLRSPRRP